jgi:hypothetical protein
MPSYETAVDAANAAKTTAALLRDARGVQRRLDKLAAGMELVHEEHAQRRATQQALRRRR